MDIRKIKRRQWLIVILLGIPTFILGRFFLKYYSNLLTIVVLLVWLGTLRLILLLVEKIQRKPIKQIQKKIDAYEKITKEEFEFWQKNYNGLTNYGTYENYLRICDLPPDKRDPFRGVDFSKIFKTNKNEH
ncbi:MAG: hypothetical protein A2Y00_09770 [Omnitrophica WOR_2 bacterium GWF2_43_52]|nr:MAG: hypothetical protein A2Y01_00540 [Omnitrophica WOR_2 bacterium GWC2_44_8]OGX21517.1 MAG: hypothetical protein A2Y00_09770 [Omnitrophica WOR_2 bacterium GWF2_43_52]OGX53587.1 MAG: hypothetical protein A2460_00570 [Omnitrophica WOR_2 bacterium RIFOXYC2_FULL_43_9]HAH19402.1 hypothetical protein [Candidatus Omnitrophota bacterium]HBG63773.1 hypothetical protein [Candidatus Omnitrophota bacterium]